MRSPRSLLGTVRGVGFFVVLGVLPWLTPAHWILNILVFTLMYAVMSSAWNLVGGFAGYPSLGHAAFFGIGAYSMNLWFEHRTLHSGYEPFLFLPVIGLFAGLVGLGVGAIAMRTRADVFAIVTITLLFVTQTLAFNLRGLTHGAQGLSIAVPPFPLATFERPFYFVLLGLLAVAMGISYGAMRSKFGLSLAAIRADEDKARGIGVRVLGVKLLAFSVSVGLTAMVGGVWAYYEGYIYPQFAVDPLVTIAIVLMTFLGGRATLWGPVIGALLLETTQQTLAYTLGGSQFYLIAYALVFLVVMLLMPQGIVPSVQDLLRRRRRRSVVDGGEPAPGADDPVDPPAHSPGLGQSMTAANGRG
ncbi:MAG TPA: branched-chain amino acid ABC transporter permease [Nocardioides sp.]|jgi:branched-chain amino acid transport system permease protein|uniref:branched-chain amino acid ABC transporter permease n=1 Tax=Nocardioides sp. TaxID=35761 RepID=UPI002E35EF1C|nr:branched-chain amino acid ABC transporter permease [Nocardioides sp.]HEX3931035.1 branched-chain amino acid ABC transporter permease [Nocardioides sp.]